MKARCTGRIVAAGLGAAGLIGLSPAGSANAAPRPTIYVVPPGTIECCVTKSAARGLYVAGAGGQISRAGAIASLQRGRVENDLLGGKPGGRVLADIAFGRAPVSAPRPVVYVELPPQERRPNTKRYPIAFVGGGYSGILVSDATRLRGLVPIADVAPTLVALQEGRSPPIRSEPVADATKELRNLDHRLTEIHRARGWVLTAVVFAVLALAVFAPWAAALGGGGAVMGSLLLSWVGVTSLGGLIAGVVAATIVLALAGSASRRLLPWVVALGFGVYLAVLALSPETNSVAVLGARPDGGGRFYGMTNQIETLLLPALLAAIVVGGRRWLLPLGALALVAVGWSKAGADGGGLLVYGTALAALALRLRAGKVTARSVVLAGAAVLAIAMALVGLDAALGGSSHVTRAVGTGPGSLLGDLGHRLHLSWASGTKAPHNIVLFLGCGAALVWMATTRPRRVTVDAMLVALVVSLLVNDTPVDVIGLGALGCAALLRWESVDSRAMRRGLVTAACALTVLVLAGCGSEGTVKPVANTVVGTVQQAAPGKAIFIAQGCGGCHTFTPAGPDANGKIGPDLDKLPQYAKQADQPLEAFTRESIVDPDKYIQPGFPKGVMPKSYGQLPPADLQALVDFLTKPQG